MKNYKLVYFPYKYVNNVKLIIKNEKVAKATQQFLTFNFYFLKR